MYCALNEKNNKETPSCHNLASLNWVGREYLWCGAHGRQKAPLTVKCDTHLVPMDNVVPVPAMVIHYIDVIQVGVCPVHQLLDHIQCHSSGLLNFIIHQPRPVGAVHVAALHLGHVPIVGEKEHSAEDWGVQMIKFWKLCCLHCWENKAYSIKFYDLNLLRPISSTQNKYITTMICRHKVIVVSNLPWGRSEYSHIDVFCQGKKHTLKKLQFF